VNRRLSRTLCRMLGGLCSAILLASAATAEPKDKAALDLAKQAIEVDYLGTNFEQAEAKLKKALALCKGNACSAAVVGQIHRDLGVVAIAGLKKLDEGKAHFVDALKADPSVQLDPDLTTAEIKAAFEEAQGAGGAAPAAEPAADDGAEEAAPLPPAAEGDLTHEPPAEQAIRTPVPVYVELPEGMTATKLTVRYKPFGSSAWKSVDMSRVKEGWGAEIPCLDVGSTTGNLAYFVQAVDAQGEVVAFSGTRNAPHQVPIKNELEGEPPHLPGKPPPAQCADSADCPPEFPGCNNGAEDGAGDASESGAPAARNIISIGQQLDLMWFSGSTGVCVTDQYACFFEDDSFYADTPDDLAGGEIEAGFRRGTTRLLVGYDRVLGGNLALGARVGYAFGGAPQAPGGNAFLPLHFEGRVTYYFGKGVLSRKGLRPFAHLSGGIAQIDSSVLVKLYLTDQDPEPNSLHAWKRAGTSFAALGGGLMYAFNPKHGLFLDVRVIQLFGESGTALSPQLGYSVGF
jgi:hypothetical protein